VNPVGEALIKFFAALDGCGIAYVVGGSFASSVWGQPRQTNDLDISLRIDSSSAGCLVVALGPDFVADEGEILRCLEESDPYRSVQFLHLETMLKIDGFIPKESPFSESVFERARPVSIAPGVFANCMSPEDTVIQKLRWFDLGNRVSDRQWNDIVQVLEVQHTNLDRAYMQEWAAHFGLKDLLEDALSQTLQD